MINTFRNHIIKSLTQGSMFDKNGYKEAGWKKNEVRDAIQRYKSNKQVLQYISDYLFLNIFVVSIVESRVYAVYPEPTFNTHKMSIFLSYYDEVFEPLELQGHLLVDYQNPVYKKVVNVSRQLIGCMVANFTVDQPEKVFEVGLEELDKYMPEEDEDDENDVDDDESDNNFDEISCDSSSETDIVEDLEGTEVDDDKSSGNPDDIFKVSPRAVLQNSDYSVKTKLDELKALALKCGVDIENGKTKTGKIKYKTKKLIVEELNNIKFA